MSTATLLCACGEPYAPGTDGRQRHRRIVGHTPSPEVVAEPSAPIVATVSSRCGRGAHQSCSGWCRRADAGPLGVCECSCHEGDEL